MSKYTGTGNNMYVPFGVLNNPVDYHFINAYNSIVSPSTVHCSNTYMSSFFAKYLIERAFSVFEFTIPDNWDRDYFLYTLFLAGFACVIRTRSYGVIVQECNISGQNVYYRPTDVYVANPLLQITRGIKIGEETELIRLQPDYTGIMDIVTFFADNMALCAEACGVNVLNSKLSFVFLTDDKAAAETYKKAYDSYASGQPMVVIGNKDLFGTQAKPMENFAFFNNDVNGSYVVDKLMAALRQWELMFDNYVGIPNNPVNKKERVIQSEVESNNVETRTLSDIWLETLEDSIERVKKMFDIELSVKYKYEVSDGILDDNIDRQDIRSRFDSRNEVK